MILFVLSHMLSTVPCTYKFSNKAANLKMGFPKDFSYQVASKSVKSKAILLIKIFYLCPGAYN